MYIHIYRLCVCACVFLCTTIQHRNDITMTSYYVRDSSTYWCTQQWPTKRMVLGGGKGAEREGYGERRWGEGREEERRKGVNDGKCTKVLYTLVCTSPILLTHIRVHVHIIPIPHSSVVPWNGNETGSSSFCPWNETCHKRAVHT